MNSKICFFHVGIRFVLGDNVLLLGSNTKLLISDFVSMLPNEGDQTVLISSTILSPVRFWVQG